MAEQTTPEIPTSTMADTVDKNGMQVRIFAEGGKQTTSDVFNSVMDNYDAGKPTPGFLVLPSQSTGATLRTGFEAVNAPIQQYGPKIGGTIAETLATPVNWIAKALLPKTVKSGTEVARETGEAVTKAALEQISTPGKAASTAITLALSLIPPIRTLSPFIRAGIMGTAGGTGYAAGEAVTGGKPSIYNAATEGVAVALGSGAEGFLNHLFTKGLGSSTGKKVANEVLDTMKAKYPHLANEPGLLDMALKSPDNLQRIVSMGNEAFRGKVSTVTNQLVDDLNAAVKLDKGLQNTLRMHSREVAKAHYNVLDNIGDPDKYDAAIQALEKANDELKTFVQSNMKLGGMSQANAEKRVFNAIDNYYTQFNDLHEGAALMDKMKKAGVEKGWNPQAVAEEIYGGKLDPGSLSDKTLGVLTRGASPTEALNQTSTLSQIGNVLDKTVGKFVPSKFKAVLPSLADIGEKVPWPKPQIMPLIRFGVQESGQSALESFAGKKK